MPMTRDAHLFAYVLVLDVSRWGRFQDPDEAAYYEFRCKQRGKDVIYTSKGFPQEGQKLMTHLQTSIERYMAAEYSRQLSEKVFHGCMNVSRLGYSAGGSPCYGLARLLLDEQRKPVRRLQKGERKQIANERVVFVPLHDDTTRIVEEIFRRFVEEKQTPVDIARVLNDRRVPAPAGGVWSREKILRILRNEVYVGTRIYNKTWNRLRQGTRRNPRSEWAICFNALPSVVSRELYSQAQEQLESLRQNKENTHMLREKLQTGIYADLAHLLQLHGFAEDEMCSLWEQFPLIFTFAGPQQPWCFFLPSPLRRYERILALSVTPHTSDLLEKCFILPTADFGLAGVLTFSEGDPSYHRYLLERGMLEERVLALAQQLRYGAMVQ
ncbi:MAG: recombinase family protein [Patescibacteria group bacterium]